MTEVKSFEVQDGLICVELEDGAKYVIARESIVRLELREPPIWIAGQPSQVLTVYQNAIPTPVVLPSELYDRVYLAWFASR